jgi:hypothetical protein
MKRMTFILLLASLTLASCGKKETTAKDVAKMKQCKKIEFLLNDKSGTIFAEITEQNKIDKVLHAMHTIEPCDHDAWLSYSIRAVGKTGKVSQAYFGWSEDMKVVYFRDGKSKEVYRLLTEYGIIQPPAPIAHVPDEEYERLKASGAIKINPLVPDPNVKLE